MELVLEVIDILVHFINEVVVASLVDIWICCRFIRMKRWNINLGTACWVGLRSNYSWLGESRYLILVSTWVQRRNYVLLSNISSLVVKIFVIFFQAFKRVRHLVSLNQSSTMAGACKCIWNFDTLKVLVYAVKFLVHLGCHLVLLLKTYMLVRGLFLWWPIDAAWIRS